MNTTDPKPSPDLLTATASFRLTEAEYRMLQLRATAANRSVSSLLHLLPRNILKSAG